jgi:hypothetical protein
MIRDLDVSRDAAGFPIVAWTEDRNLSSPEAMKRARVECRIMKDSHSGVLLFVARGTVRHGAFEEGRPWERLRGFSTQAAERLYYTKRELELRQHLGSKSVGAKVALSDSAQVLLAEFFDQTPLHINCADAPQVDLDRLHLALRSEFISRQHELVGSLCQEAFYWPMEDDRVPIFHPTPPAGPRERRSRVLGEAVGWIVALAVVAALGSFFLWAVGALRK